MHITSISTRLKTAIGTCGRSRYWISQQTGISQAALSRFISGERSLSLDSVDKLCEVLKLRLVGGIKAKGR